MKIELDLDLNAHLARHIGYDEDGDIVQQPTTLEDVVQQWIHEAVNHKVARELGEALDEGKAQVKAALQSEGARIMAEAIGKMART